MRIPQKGGHHLGRKRPPSLREKAATSETKRKTLPQTKIAKMRQIEKPLTLDELSENETKKKLTLNEKS